MGNLFHAYIYEPVFAVLVWIYQVVPPHDLGVSIILLTFVVRIVLLPLFWKSAKDQSILQMLQPKVKEVQENHKGDREAQGRALIALYREHRVNPLSGIFFLILQLPVFIALFQIFTRELTNAAFDSTVFLGLINLEEKSIVLAILAAGLQYFQARLMPTFGTSKTNGTNKFDSAKMTKLFGLVVGPAITLVILTSLPSALGLYWVTSTIFSIGQQLVINKTIKRELPKEITASH
ncbi:MAG: YidC/Oxa1 family membrane protein insertase [Candidatus Jorgensenbacteria bacterium]|nr:YidC/Oxa1 family membrane protein insertase [Candidatus Jorgensenbacteria bacterium]